MAAITSYPPGTFCWTELATTDQGDAKRFYGELFGWGANDVPLGGDGAYSMMQAEGRDAAAIQQQRADERDKGIPPHWRSYVAVADADEASRRVADAGGKVLAGPFDVFESGRMSVAQDPTGAVFALWQARRHLGAGWANDPGGVVWNELLTRDTATAAQFYARVFGWAAEAQAGGPVPYTVFKNAGRLAGGMMEISPQMEQIGPMHAQWGVYFGVTDCDATVQRAVTLGGRVVMPPMDVAGVGRIAVLADAQGASFSIMKAVAPPPA